MIVWNVKVAILKGSLLSKTQERALHSTARLLTQEQMSARRAQSDRAGGREMSHWARGRLIQVSWFADILQTKVSLQRIRESLLTMRGGEAVGGPVVCFVTAAEVMGCWVGKQKLWVFQWGIPEVLDQLIKDREMDLRIEPLLSHGENVVKWRDKDITLRSLKTTGEAHWGIRRACFPLWWCRQCWWGRCGAGELAEEQEHRTTPRDGAWLLNPTKPSVTRSWNSKPSQKCLVQILSILTFFVCVSKTARTLCLKTVGVNYFSGKKNVADRAVLIKSSYTLFAHRFVCVQCFYDFSVDAFHFKIISKVYQTASWQLHRSTNSEHN